jgi:hypothetical protein
MKSIILFKFSSSIADGRRNQTTETHNKDNNQPNKRQNVIAYLNLNLFLIISQAPYLARERKTIENHKRKP